MASLTSGTKPLLPIHSLGCGGNFFCDAAGVEEVAIGGFMAKSIRSPNALCGARARVQSAKNGGFNPMRSAECEVRSDFNAECGMQNMRNMRNAECGMRTAAV